MGVFDNLDPVAGLDNGDSGAFGEFTGPGEVSKGLRRGALRLGAQAARTAEAASTAVGFGAGKGAAANVATDLNAQADELAPKVPTSADIHSVRDAADYATSLVSENAVQLPVLALSAFLGGKLGARLSGTERALATISGGAAGAFIPSYIQNFGDVYNEQREAGLDDVGTAAKYALPIAALDSVGPGLLAHLITTPEKAAMKRGVKELVKDIAKGIIGGAAEETPTEALQEDLGIRAHAAVDPNFDPNSDENNQRRREAAIGGGVVGGVVGGAGGAVHHVAAPLEQPIAQPSPVETPPTQAAPVQTAPVQTETTPTSGEVPLPTITPTEDVLPLINANVPDVLDEAFKQSRVAAADAEFAANPEQVTAKFLNDQVATGEARLTALAAELKLPARERRPKQEIVRERAQLTEQLPALKQKAATASLVAGTPKYVEKSPLVEGTLLNVQKPEVPNVPSSAIIQTSDVGSVLRGPIEEASQAVETNETTQQVQAGRDATEIFQEQVARIRKSQGILLSADEIKSIGKADAKIAASAKPIEAVVSRARESLKFAPVETRAESFMNESARVVESNVKELVANGMVRDTAAPTVQHIINESIRKGLETQDVARAKAMIESGIEKALKGKIAKTDIPAVSDKIIAAISAQPNRFVPHGTGGTLTTTRRDIPAGIPEQAEQMALKVAGIDPVTTANELAAARAVLEATQVTARAQNTLTPELNAAIEAGIADIDAAFKPIPLKVGTNGLPAPFDLGKAQELSDKIVSHHAAFTGGSWNLVTGQEMAGTANYSVSPYKGREVIVPGNPTSEQIREYINANQDMLQNPANVLGTWFNPEDGNTYIDISILTPSFTKAQNIAKKANQKAFFNLRTMDTIATDQPVPSQAALFRNVQSFVNLDTLQRVKGREALDYLEFILGTPSRLEVRPFVQSAPNGHTGVFRGGHMKDVIELAMNAKDVLSVAAHEGFHFVETRYLDGDERVVLKRAFAKDTALFKQLQQRALRYDQEHHTDIANEIAMVPAEAHAYAYEFWKRGELKADGALASVFRKILQLLTAVRNYIDGFGFNTAEDIFRSIDAGEYAQRENQALRIDTPAGESWFDDIEHDAIPGLQRKGDNTAASVARGRPYWVKSGPDVAKMRRRLKTLALEGESARTWHRESGEEMLKLYNGDQKQAEILAKLVAVFSPRTPVGTDLMFALKAINQFRANEPIHAGVFPKEMSRKALQILTGKEEDKLVTGIKRNTFYRNLMNAIDPVNHSTESQGATIDMWMAHAFGFNHSVNGEIGVSEYRYAEAEVGRLARELGWTIEETQAAIWVSTKARYNQVRSDAKKWGVNKGLFEAAKNDSRQTDIFGTEGGRAQTLKSDEKTQRKYLENWTKLAMSVPLDQKYYEDASYNYGIAIREMKAEGKLTPHKIESGDALFAELGVQDDTQNGIEDSEQFSLKFYSRAALADLITSAKRGEAQLTQMQSIVGKMIDTAEIPEDMQRSVFGNTIKGYTRGTTSSMKTFYDENVSSGMQLSRKSAGYKNVFDTLSAYNQRKNRLIADSVDGKLSEWREGATNANLASVSKAMLDRTVNGWKLDDPQLKIAMQKLDQKERAMFKQATDMIADRLRAEFEADKRSFAKLLGADSPQYAEWLGNRTVQVQQLIDDGYFPERRYGDHGVHTYIEVDGKRLTLNYELHEHRGEAERQIANLNAVLRDFPDIKTEYAFKYKAEYDGSVSFQQFLDMARRNGIELTQGEKERLAKALVASDSVRRNRIFRRKNIPGYSEDGQRILAEFAVVMSNKIAYSEFGSAIQDALKGIVVQTKFDVNGNPEINTYENSKANAWRQDGELAGFYRNLADRTTDFVTSPNPGNKVSSALRAAATFQFLGGSLSAGAVQLSSLAMNTAPWLSAHTSYTNALAKTLAGLKVAATNHKALTNIHTLQDKNHAIPDVDSVPGLRTALTVAAQDGTTLDTEIYQIMGLTRARVLSMSRGVQKAAEVWMAPFRVTEQWNRISTFIAAYKIGQENNLTGDALYKFAQESVAMTQGRYDEANRPALARSPVGALLFTFKAYPIFMLETMTHLAKENPKAAVIMLLSLTAMAGIEGMPFAEDIEDVIDTVAQRVFHSSFNSKRAMRNMFKSASEAIVGVDLSGVLMHGAANQLTGLNFASRVGMGNLLPGTRIGAADADYKKVMSEVLGPAGSVATGWLNGVDALNRGEFVEAMKVGGPLAAQNFIKGVQSFQDGFATDAGGRKVVDASGWESFMQTLGFSSNAASNAYEVDRIDKAQAAFYKQAQQEITNDILKGIKSGDTQRVHDAIEYIGAWNRSNPDMPMAISGSSLRRTLALAGLPLNQRNLLMLPKTLRGGSESMSELYGANR